ncbi:MAG: hypothetical protein H8D78_13660 [Chloroflexi bacterium]|nr:hypothetical protein [Chloroflexota bacterium]
MDLLRLVFGRSRKRRNFVRQVRRFVVTSQQMFGAVPTLIGETSIPFNLRDSPPAWG